MGVLFNVLLFTFLNIITFIDRRNNFITLEAPGIRVSGAWGFPIPMCINQRLSDPYNLIINIFIYVIGSFFFGFLFKLIWSKISQRLMELK